MPSENRINSRIRTSYKYFQAVTPFLAYTFLILFTVLYLVFPTRIPLSWELLTLFSMIIVLPFLPYVSKISLLDSTVETRMPSWEDQRDDVEGDGIAKSSPEASELTPEEL